MARTIARVQEATLRYQQGAESHSLAVGGPDWFAWLAGATTFAFTSEQGSFTARKERASNRRGGAYWYAYRRQERQLQKVYLGGARPGAQRSPSTGIAHAGLADLLREWNQLDAAAGHLAEAIELCQRWGHTGYLAISYMTYARVLQAQGDPADAHAMISRRRS